MDDSDKQKSEITLIDYLYILARWRGTIIWTSLISCVLALVISLLLPNTYEARATIMPPENKTSMPVGLSSLLMNTNLPLSGLGIPSLTNTSELFVQVLISRSILDRIITQYDLQKIYNTPNNEATIIRLRQNLSIKTEKANIISVEVEASDPQLAADMANSFINELDRFNRDNTLSSAKNSRIFIEKRVNEAKLDLENALIALRLFQEKYDLISLPEQVMAAVEALAEVESQIRLSEFELAVKRKMLHAQHPEIVRVQIGLGELRNQRSHLKYGSSNTSPTIEKRNLESKSYIPFNRLPEIQLQLGKLMMEVKIQRSIVEILLQQYEQAKIQEVHDTPTVRRLDSAVPPLTRSSPRRILIIVITGVVVLFLTSAGAFLVEYGRMVTKDEKSVGKVKDIYLWVQSDIRRLNMFFKKS
jgi:uncharacterized protein involved in exopolysaccharide biosynthesis